MRPQILHDYIIKPVLEHMGSKYNTKAARQLLLATAAQESHCGFYAKQVKGPALGLYQMEKPTLNDLYENYLYFHPSQERIVENFNIINISDKIELVGNNYYSTAIARMQYWRDSEPMPDFNDFDGMWTMYKRVWNTHLGKATLHEFQENWIGFVKNVDF
jgi:hypothetical protein